MNRREFIKRLGIAPAILFIPQVLSKVSVNEIPIIKVDWGYNDRSVITIVGKDENGNRIIEEITLNGIVPVETKKTFY